MMQCAESYTHPVQLHVQAAGIADGLTLCVSPPQCGGAGMTVSATQTRSPRRALLLRQTEREKYGEVIHLALLTLS